MNAQRLPRRSIIRAATAIATGAIAAAGLATPAPVATLRGVKNGRINQSASRWCYGKLTLDQLC